VDIPDTKQWLSRFRVAQQASDEARRGRPLPSADESLTRAFEVMKLAEECGIRKPSQIAAEDLAMYQQRARLCEPYVLRALR
jgi:hypothetical protein